MIPFLLSFYMLPYIFLMFLERFSLNLFLRTNRIQYGRVTHYMTCLSPLLTLALFHFPGLAIVSSCYGPHASFARP